MRNKIFLFFLILILETTLALAQTKANGYFSLNYIKGQKQSDVSHGSFQNALLGLIFSGEIRASIDYLTEVRFKEEEGNVELEQLLVGFKPSASFNLKLGLYLVPFGRYNQSNRAHQTLLINNPLNVEKAYPSSWKDIGFLLEGRFGSFFYSTYLGNGLAESENLSRSQQHKDNNANKGKGGRVGFALSQWAEVAYSYYKGKYDEENRRDLVLQGVDLVWTADPVQVLSEYSRAYLENPENFGAGKVEGFFIQASFVIDILQPVFSYQRIRYEDAFHGPGFVSPEVHGGGISEKKSRWAVGLTYSISRDVFLKFEYDFNREKGLELKNNSFSIQIALSF